VGPSTERVTEHEAESEDGHRARESVDQVRKPPNSALDCETARQDPDSVSLVNTRQSPAVNHPVVLPSGRRVLRDVLDAHDAQGNGDPHRNRAPTYTHTDNGDPYGREPVRVELESGSDGASMRHNKSNHDYPDPRHCEGQIPYHRDSFDPDLLRKKAFAVLAQNFQHYESTPLSVSRGWLPPRHVVPKMCDGDSNGWPLDVPDVETICLASCLRKAREENYHDLDRLKLAVGIISDPVEYRALKIKQPSGDRVLQKPRPSWQFAKFKDLLRQRNYITPISRRKIKNFVTT
jgi:hypothetical protein